MPSFGSFCSDFRWHLNAIDFCSDKDAMPFKNLEIMRLLSKVQLRNFFFSTREVTLHNKRHIIGILLTFQIF